MRFWRFTRVVPVPVVHSFLPLLGISSCGHTALCLSIPLLLPIWGASKYSGTNLNVINERMLLLFEFSFLYYSFINSLKVWKPSQECSVFWCEIYLLSMFEFMVLMFSFIRVLIIEIVTSLSFHFYSFLAFLEAPGEGNFWHLGVDNMCMSVCVFETEMPQLFRGI